MSRLLIIDDEKEICLSLKGILEDEGYEVRYALTLDQAWELLLEDPPSLVLLDVWFGKNSWDGCHFLEMLQQVYPILPIIMVSGHGSFEMAVRAIQRGAYDFIEKPFDVERLFVSIKRALEVHRLRLLSQNEPPELEDEFALEGSSQAVKKLREDVERVAAMGSRVFIVGENGMGRRSVARDIHTRSRVALQPCLALHAHKLNEFSDEMLWGLEEGSVVKHVGVFERVRGGTLIIDNVEALSEPLQEALLRLIERKSFLRVQGTRAIPFKTRVISLSAHENPALLQNLLNRLIVTSIMIPSLRRRVEDIPFILEQLTRKCAERFSLPQKTFSTEAMQVLCAYAWPGNIAEMANFVERLFLVYPHNENVTSDLLPQNARDTISTMEKGPSAFLSLPLQKARALFEQQYLLAQLARMGGNVARVAAFVGMERSALYRKLKGFQQPKDEDTCESRSY